MPGEIAASCADACAVVQPGFNRPMAASHQAFGLLVLGFGPVITGSEQIGRATSKRRPTSIPKKLGGVTPIISNGCPSSFSFRPTTEGFAPNSLCQKESLITSPPAPQPCWPSEGEINRPSAGRIPSVSKKLALTHRASAY